MNLRIRKLNSFGYCVCSFRWAYHVARVGERRGAYWAWWGNQRERDHFEDLAYIRRIALKLIFKKYGGTSWISWLCLRTVTSGGVL
jgi:hypothetical protein